MSHSMFSKKKLIIILTISFSALGLTYGLFVSQSNIEQDKAKIAYRKGFLLYNEYKFNVAQDFFLKSLSYDPNFSMSRRMLGQALYFSGNIDEAINEWKLVFNNNTYDPSLKLHIQNLRSFHVESKLDIQFKKILKKQMGYKYVHPTFIGTLPSHQMVFLASGLDDKGSLITISSQGEYKHHHRRISGPMGLPMGVAVSKNEIWITDYKRDGIHRINRKHINSINFFNDIPFLGETGSQNLQFRGPAGICYHNQAFYIADSENNRIQKISTDGKFILNIDSIQANHTLRDPFGIACSKDGKLFVSQPEESRIIVFDIYGNYIKTIGKSFLKKPRHIQIDDKNKYLVIADEEQGVFIVDIKNGKKHHIKGYYDLDNHFIPFNKVYSAQFDFYGNLYIADYASNNIIQFIPKNFLYTDLDLWIERIDAKMFPDIGVWVSVKDQTGKYITDLEADNFSLLENDAHIQNIGTSYLKKFNHQMNMVIVLSRAKRMKNYLDTLARILDPLITNLYTKDKIQVMSYNETFREDSPFTNSTLRLRKSLLNYNENDYLNDKNLATGKVLYLAISKLLDKRGKKAVVWIFDGSISEESFHTFSLSKIANYAKNNHIPIFIINFEHPNATSQNINKQNLIDFTNSTSGKYYKGYSEKVKNIRMQIAKQISEQYVLSYTSNGNKDWKDQYMDIKVKVNFQNRTGVENLGFFIP